MMWGDADAPLTNNPYNTIFFVFIFCFYVQYIIWGDADTPLTNNPYNTLLLFVYKKYVYVG